MSDEFKIEIVNPEKSFLSKEDVNEVVVPAFEGEMGILKDAEEESNKPVISDQLKYLADQKVETLKSIN